MKKKHLRAEIASLRAKIAELEIANSLLKSWKPQLAPRVSVLPEIDLASEVRKNNATVGFLRDTVRDLCGMVRKLNDDFGSMLDTMYNTVRIAVLKKSDLLKTADEKMTDEMEEEMFKSLVEILPRKSLEKLQELLNEALKEHEKLERVMKSPLAQAPEKMDAARDKT